MTTIRRMEERDFDRVFEIEEAAHELSWTRGLFREYMEEGFQVFVLDVDNKVVSFAVVDMVSMEANILNISVDPDFQGKGYGKTLTKHLVELAKEHHCESLFLEVRSSRPCSWRCVAVRP